MSERGTVTLTVEFKIKATSVRTAENWLDLWLLPVEDNDDLEQYEIVKSEWETLQAH